MRMLLKFFALVAGLIFFIYGHAADVDRNMIRDCKHVAEKLEKQNRKFPMINDSSITPLYTWRASVCETPPSGKGVVTALCDAQTANGTHVFFWEKKSDHSFMRDFLTCR